MPLLFFFIIEAQVTTLSLQQLIKALRKNRGRFEACVYMYAGILYVNTLTF